ncbi:MAG: hypothetical protein R3A79_27535 [Nannocystaceae bacterium]
MPRSLRRRARAPRAAGREGLASLPRGARAALLGGVLAVAAASGCAYHRGAWTGRPAAALVDAEPGPELRIFVVGEPGAGGRHAKRVAARVDERVAASRELGIPSVLVWPGSAGTPARCDGSVARRAAPLAALAQAHVAGGGASVASVGDHDWLCERSQTAWVDRLSEAPPVELAVDRAQAQGCADADAVACVWPQPTLNYVVRIDRQGQARRVSTCAGAPLVCAIAEDGGDAVVDLVVLDTGAWLRSPDAASAKAAAERSLAEQGALLAALAERGRGGPERILVANHPIESAGPHGLGGLFADIGFLYHSLALQEALVAGAFAGVLSAYERSLQVTPDLSAAIQRSSRAWIDYPVFQVISGTSSRGGGVGARTWPFFQGIALAPDHRSDRPGFAELTITGDAFVVALHARRGGRWQVAKTTIPRRRPPARIEATLPGMEPCLTCDTRDPEARARDVPDAPE